MRSTYYPGVLTKPGTYYQGWFMYMRYTQGQNEEYLLSRSTVRALIFAGLNFRGFRGLEAIRESLNQRKV